MRSSHVAAMTGLFSIGLFALGPRPATSATDVLDQATACPTRAPLGPDEPAPKPRSGAHEYEREGNVYSFGMGAASMQVLCVGCVSDGREAFASFNMRAGRVVREDLVIGLEADVWIRNQSGWIRDDRNLLRTLAAVSLVALYYPRESSGLFL